MADNNRNKDIYQKEYKRESYMINTSIVSGTKRENLCAGRIIKSEIFLLDLKVFDPQYMHCKLSVLTEPGTLGQNTL